MQTQKIFFKKTRRGKIVKVVREHYLRDDLPCASELCEECPRPALGHLLARDPVSRCPGLFRRPHYLVLDTNVVLEQIDVLESGNGFVNVVLLQTVLEEVRNRSTPVYKRLKDLVADEEKKFVVFMNEHHQSTYVRRLPGESANDRNDRAIRCFAAWFGRDHFASRDVDVVLLTDDAENRSKAKAEGIPVATIAQYVKAMTDYPMLADKLSLKTNKNSEQQGYRKDKDLFEAHLSPSEINRGVKAGRLKVGVFYISRNNYLEGTVVSETLDRPALVRGLAHMNRAVDGDSVSFEVLDESEWAAPADLLLEDDVTEDREDSLEKEEAKLRKKKNKEELQPTAKVVGVVKRKWRQYCGILQPNPIKGATRHIFVPAEKKIPKIRIETRQSAVLLGQRIIVAVDSWPRHSRYPLGHFVRTLGPIGDKATENEVLLLEHDIPHSSFSQAVLNCLPKNLPWKISEEEEAKRVDLRHVDVCSVDPPGCTDIDDALHCRELDGDLLEVGVHIADVSHFVRPGTALDAEAARRSTTVYLTDRRIDMVPELLSSNLCSLRGGEDRLAFSCIWVMNRDAEILSTKFHKSIIRSRSAMTYEQAQNKIDDPSDNDVLAKSLRILLKLSKTLKRRRMDNGALVLASSEIRFDVDSETADPIDVQAKEMRETNSMVEEFMLAANISAAERIFADFPDCAMLRRHPAPPPSNFDPLVKAGRQQGFEINVDTGKDLADSLNAAVDKKNGYLNTMLRMIATRCMMQAIYFASGTIEKTLFMHYGLACPIYTHFTSPIRRYADVIVHRLLAVSIGADATYPDLLDKKVTQNIANNINYRHRMAQYASRASVNLHTHIFFRTKRKDETGYILFVRQNAIQVLIPKYGLEGTLYLRNDDDTSTCRFKFDEDEPSQTASDGSKLSLFQQVTVQLTLDQTNVQHEKLMVKLVEPKIQGFSVDPAEPEDDGAGEQGKKRPLEKVADGQKSILKQKKRKKQLNDQQ